MAKKDKKVKIRVLPLRGIGGIGNAGTEAMVTQEEAEHWVAEGYAELVTDEPTVVPSTAAATQDPVESEAAPEADTEAGDHKIMSPENKRD